MKSLLTCLSVVMLVAAVPSGAIAQSAKQAAPAAAQDCDAKVNALDASDTEGDERLTEKNEVIDVCEREHRKNATVTRLVKECRKYDEQAIVKQQTVADCVLLAYRYANSLRDLKAYYRK